MSGLFRHRDLWREWGLWMAIVAVGFYYSFEFDETLDVYKWGATGWPRFILACLGLGASLQLIMRLIRRRGKIPSANLPDDLRPPFVQPRLVVIFILSLAFLYLIPRAGFYVMALIYLVLLLLSLEVRRIRPMAITLFCIGALLLLLFTRFFYVPLPVGNWPVFYDVNNWIVVMARKPLFGG